MPWKILDPEKIRYSDYTHPDFPSRRFSFEHFSTALDSYSNHGVFSQSLIGHSIENRPIRSLRYGSGPERVVLWSQMHGNEATATRAFFDVFEFLSRNDQAQNLSEKLSLYFIPVLNPDGLERYQRRNAWDIDLNRDAVSRVSPEMNVLLETIDTLAPGWCFNMHDQRNLFNVKGSAEPATMAFLSPSTGKTEFSQNQADAQMLIDQLNQDLQGRIPGAVSRFTDEFYPSATGDNLQRNGFRTVLVEAGGYRNDPERQVAREMNFWTLLHAFDLIASGNWHKGTKMGYGTIPQNDQKMVDLMLRNVRIEQDELSLVIDVGIERKELEDRTAPDGFRYTSVISQLGDLRHYFGYEEWDGKGEYSTVPLSLNSPANLVLKGNNENFVRIENGWICDE